MIYLLFSIYYGNCDQFHEAWDRRIPNSFSWGEIWTFVFLLIFIKILYLRRNGREGTDKHPVVQTMEALTFATNCAADFIYICRRMYEYASSLYPDQFREKKFMIDLLSVKFYFRIFSHCYYWGSNSTGRTLRDWISWTETGCCSQSKECHYNENNERRVLQDHE